LAAQLEAVKAQPMAEDVLLIDDPAPKIRRLTLNRPDKRNALDDSLRGALFDALRAGDRDKDVSVMIVRGAGKCAM
jgi:enoyl-CoA hydratase